MLSPPSWPKSRELKAAEESSSSAASPIISLSFLSSASSLPLLLPNENVAEELDEDESSRLDMMKERVEERRERETVD
jgi:hypothetical protein